MFDRLEIPRRSALSPPKVRVGVLPCAVVLVTLSAFALRAYGLDYSLPYVDHPDEPNLITYALRTLATGDLNPQVFRKPSLYFYMLLPVLWAHYQWGQAASLYTDLAQMTITTHQYTTVPGFFYSGRMLTATLGGATALVMFYVGTRSLGALAGLVAALVVAVSPFHMQHSQYVTTDVPSALFVLLAFGASLSVMRQGNWRSYLVAGLLAGLAAAAKYNAGVVVTAIAGAHMLYWGRRWLSHLGRLAGAGVATLLGFVIGTPYAVLDWANFRRGVITQFRDYNVTVHGDFVGAWNAEGYLDFFWGIGLGPMGCAALVVGIAVLVAQRPKFALLWLSFAGPYILALLSQESHFHRNLMPLLVLCALPIGASTTALWDWLRARATMPLRVAVAALGLALLLAPWMVPSVTRAVSLGLPDSRVVAQETLRQRWPGVRVAGELSQVMRWDGVTQSTYLHYLPLRPLAWYREQGYGLLLSTSGKRKGYGWPSDYAELLEEGPIVASFGGPGSDYRGPQVDIIDTGLTPATAPVEAPRVRVGPLDLLGATVGRREETTTGPEVEMQRRMRAGDIISINAFWSAWQTPPSAPYVAFVHLRDAQGRTLAQRDAPPWMELFPVPTWPVGKVVVDSLELQLPENLPPGEYHLWLGLYDGATQVRFPATARDQRLAGDEVDLGSIEVLSPE